MHLYYIVLLGAVVVLSQFCHGGATKTLQLVYSTKEMARLRGGPLVGKMLKDMKAKKANTSSVSMFMYAGHDTTLVAVMSAMGIFNQVQPPYAADLLVEVRLDQNEYTVEVSYKNETDKEPYSMIVPQCGNRCTLTKLNELLYAKIPTDISRMQDWSQGNQLWPYWRVVCHFWNWGADYGRLYVSEICSKKKGQTISPGRGGRTV